MNPNARAQTTQTLRPSTHRIRTQRQNPSNLLVHATLTKLPRRRPRNTTPTTPLKPQRRSPPPRKTSLTRPNRQNPNRRILRKTRGQSRPTTTIHPTRTLPSPTLPILLNLVHHHDDHIPRILPAQRQHPQHGSNNLRSPSHNHTMGGNRSTMEAKTVLIKEQECSKTWL